MLTFNRKSLLSSVLAATVMVAIVFVALISAPTRLSAAEFFESIEDLPLAPGLIEVVEEGVQFDSPVGRIVTAVAVGDARLDSVRAFYRKALPSLGWLLAPGGTYLRDGEVLTLRLEIVDKGIKLRIRVVLA